MDRPAVVVNSLLCFLHNYRSQMAGDQLRQLLSLYFPQTAMDTAQSLLVELLTTINNGEMAIERDSDRVGLLQLFDQVDGSEQAPLFAAADLNELPLCLISDEIDQEMENNSRTELLRELRQIRTLIHNNNNNNNNNNKPDHHHNRRQPSSSSRQHDHSSTKTTSKNKCLVSASSPESPSTSSTSTSLNSLNPTIVSSQSNGTSSNLSPAITTTPPIHQHQRRPDRLDAAVKKLADRQSKSLDVTNVFPQMVITNGSTPTSMVIGNGSTSTSMVIGNGNTSTSSTTSSSSSSSINPPTWTPPPPSTVDATMAYMNLLRQWSQPSPVSNIFPVLPSASLQQAVNMLNDKTAPDLEMLEDEKDGDEKTLTDDSRSPSEEGSNGGNRMGDEFSSTIDSGDKPFECEHTNCHKRFANKFLLKKHQFIHTGLRPHSCPYCGKKFNRKDNLLRHKKTHVANAVVNAKRRHTMVFGVPETMLGLGESSAIAATMPEGEGDDDDL